MNMFALYNFSKRIYFVVSTEQEMMFAHSITKLHALKYPRFVGSRDDLFLYTSVINYKYLQYLFQMYTNNML